MRPITSQSTLREEVCGTYWPVVCTDVERRGYPRPEAEDLTQEFFAHLLRRDRILRVDPRHGSYRAFIFNSLNHFLINAWHRRRALKRGGQTTTVSWEELPAQTRFCSPGRLEISPVRRLEQRAAIHLIERVASLLRAQSVKAGRAGLFDLLEPFLAERTDRGWYARTAEGLGITPESLRVALHRLRRRFGQLLRQELRRHCHSTEELNQALPNLLKLWQE